MEHSATYSPEDNKLRLYPACRLDADEYAKVKAAGFIWAPNPLTSAQSAMMRRYHGREPQPAHERLAWDAKATAALEYSGPLAWLSVPADRQRAELERVYNLEVAK